MTKIVKLIVITSLAKSMVLQSTNDEIEQVN